MLRISDRVAIVAAADAPYFAWLDGMLASLEDSRLPFSADVCIFDVGLSEDQRRNLAARVARVLSPGWAIDFPTVSSAPGWYRAMVDRPAIPQFFPGYELYLWLDSDLWVQDGTCLREFVDAAEDGALAVVAEKFGAPVKYASRTPDGRTQVEEVTETTSRQTVARAYRECFGTAYERHASGPLLNSGAFCLRGDSPAWGVWLEYLTAVLQRGVKHFLAEQTALNAACADGRIRFRSLRLGCNWNIWTNHPVLDEARGTLLEPATRQVIGLVHCTTAKKFRGLRLPTTAGGAADVPLAYREFRTKFPPQIAR